MVVGMKKIVKLTFVGEKDMSKTEELLFQVALHELKEGSLSDFGVVFNQPIITPGEAGSFIEIEYPSDIKERIDVYNEQAQLFKEMVHAHTVIKGDVIITDLRGVEPIYTGNRFMIYSLYPEQNISAWIVSGKGGQGCSAAVGYSILNRTSKVNVGQLMLKYGGGGHKAVGTCQFTDENMDTELPKMLDELVNYDKYYNV